MEPISPQPGSARDPRYFVGRQRTTKDATRKLCDGTSLLLNDPRRLGKTYWLTYFTSRTHDFTPVVIDYEGVSTCEAFLVRTVEELRKQLPRFSRSLLTKLQAYFENVEVNSGPVKVKIAVQQQPATTLLAITLAELVEHSAKPVLICMDEIPLAILNIARTEDAQSARELLQTLRRLRQNEPRIRWILAGSIGFHHVLAECGTTSGEINDLDNLRLGPLIDAEATELAQRLLLGIARPPNEGAIDRLVERTGGIPFLLHKVASLLLDNGEREVPVDPAEVDEAFEGFIDDPDEFQAFSHVLARLEPNYGDDAVLAKQILDHTLSATNDWHGLDEVRDALGASPRFAGTVEDLVSDHYLIQDGQRIRWRYPVLQYTWARRQAIWDRP
ncbi:MAG: hypothetical protein QM650_05505 [Microlunatus sp.]